MQFTLTELWGHMGLFARFIVALMAVMSFASLVVVAERVLLFRSSRKQSRLFAEQMAAALEKGDIDAAAGKVSSKTKDGGGYLGRTITAGLQAYRRSYSRDADITTESVARALERQQQREVQILKRGLGLLATVGSLAPFVGLLGTTMGIVNAFEQMAASGSGGLGTVSAGISEALLTTAIGLLVAIPAVAAYNFLQGWVDARAVDLSESSNEFLDLVARRLGGTSATPTLPET